MTTQPTTVAELLRKLRRSGDPILARRLWRVMRNGLGLDYHGAWKLYGKANGLGDETAEEEWEEHMQEAVS